MSTLLRGVFDKSACSTWSATSSCSTLTATRWSLGRDDDHAAAELAWTALLACDGLDTPRATRYSDLVWASLGQAARRILEEDVMAPQTYEYQSDHVRRYIDQGRDEGRREVLLELLAARFGDLSDPVRQRVEQADLDQLKRWNTRVIDPDATLEKILDLEP